MKRCQKCNFESDAMLDYCWQCGTLLTNVSSGGGVYQGAPRTQEYSLPNQQFNNYGQNYTPNYQPRAGSVSLGRVAAVLGGFFLVLLLIIGAGAAVVYKVMFITCASCKEPRPMPVRETEPVKNNPVNDKAKSDKASTKFEKIWVDYNVRENGRLGMRIHVKFSVFNMKDVDSQMAVYFEKADGTRLKTTAKNFSSKDGETAVFRALKPGYDETIYKDLEVFMPYDELKLGRGKYDLKMDVDVIYENGDLVEHLAYHDFRYEKK